MKYKSMDKSVDREDFIFNGKTTFHRLMKIHGKSGHVSSNWGFYPSNTPPTGRRPTGKRRDAFQTVAIKRPTTPI